MDINNVIIVNWDPNDFESSQKAIYIGLYQGVEDNLYSEGVSLMLYGFGVSTLADNKDYQLHQVGLHGSNVSGIPKEISKEDARKLLIAELDKNLDFLYSEEAGHESTRMIMDNLKERLGREKSNEDKENNKDDE